MKWEGKTSMEEFGVIWPNLNPMNLKDHKNSSQNELKKKNAEFIDSVRVYLSELIGIQTGIEYSIEILDSQ